MTIDVVCVALMVFGVSMFIWSIVGKLNRIALALESIEKRYGGKNLP